MQNKRRQNSNWSAKGKAIAWTLTALLVLCGCGAKPYSETRILLDTVVTITVESGKKDALKEGFELIETLGANLDWRVEGGDVHRVNNGSGWQKVSAETYQCLELGRSISEATEGAFDITALALTELYDFKEQTLPTDQQLEQQLKNVGWQHLQMNNGEVRITQEGVRLDLGGIAKGFIADKLRELLIARGVKQALIDLGGNLHTICSKKDYRVGVQKPFAPRGDYFTTITLNNAAVATSGVYERSFELDGVLYHHVLDLKTGRPLETPYMSCTVVADSAAVADAASTAGLILGDLDKNALKIKEVLYYP